jgi:hypothetical protein
MSNERRGRDERPVFGVTSGSCAVVACEAAFQATDRRRCEWESRVKLPQFPVQGGCQCGAVRYRLTAALFDAYAAEIAKG